MSNIVNLQAHRRAATSTPASADLRGLQDLESLCADAIAAGGLEVGGPTALDFMVAVHRVLKGCEWSVRFYRGEESNQ